jgi:uncharacterized cupin superfamily protein
VADDATNVWDDVPDWGGVGARRLARSPEAELGGSLWEIQPGGSQFVYHFHHGSDELLVVLRGEPTVRLHDGEQTLSEGDVLPLPHGPRGGHQLRNDRGEVARVLIVSTNVDPDVAEYPDSGKVGIAASGANWRFFRETDAAEHAGSD